MWLCHTSGTLFVVKQINNTCKMYINVLYGPMKSGKVKEFCLMKRWCKGRSGLADNFFLFTVYIFSPCTSDFPLFPNKTSQLLESCWPITNEWLLGSFWTVFAQCCWWGGHSPSRPYSTVAVNSPSVLQKYTSTAFWYIQLRYIYNAHAM